MHDCLRVLLLSLIIALAAGPWAAADPPEAPAKVWVFLENDHLKLGLLRSHGGAMGHLSLAGSKANLLNHYDHGRLVQQSYYGDMDGSRWAKKPWRFNPVQGGDYRGKAAKVVELKASDTTAYVKTTPRHWATGKLLEDCRMEQWTILKGPVAHIRYRFSYTGSQTHQPRHQETPAMFVAPRLSTLVAYSGANPWQDEAVEQRTPGWPNEYLKLTESWAAYVGQDGAGVGVFVPGAERATCYRFQAGAGSDCSYVAPIRTFAIKPGLVFSYDAYFTIGDVATIRQRFRAIHEAAP